MYRCFFFEKKHQWPTFLGLRTVPSIEFSRWKFQLDQHTAFSWKNPAFLKASPEKLGPFNIQDLKKKNMVTVFLASKPFSRRYARRFEPSSVAPKMKTQTCCPCEDDMDVEPKIGVVFTPQNGWFISWKTLLKWMIWGYHYFLETPTFLGLLSWCIVPLTCCKRGSITQSARIYLKEPWLKIPGVHHGQGQGNFYGKFPSSIVAIHSFPLKLPNKSLQPEYKRLTEFIFIHKSFVTLPASNLFSSQIRFAGAINGGIQNISNMTWNSTFHP